MSHDRIFGQDETLRNSLTFSPTGQMWKLRPRGTRDSLPEPSKEEVSGSGSHVPGDSPPQDHQHPIALRTGHQGFVCLSPLRKVARPSGQAEVARAEHKAAEFRGRAEPEPGTQASYTV